MSASSVAGLSSSIKRAKMARFRDMSAVLLWGYRLDVTVYEVTAGPKTKMRRNERTKNSIRRYPSEWSLIFKTVGAEMNVRFCLAVRGGFENLAHVNRVIARIYFGHHLAF